MAIKQKIGAAFRPHQRVQITFPDQGKTHQSFAPECDVNNIMARYEKTGLIDHVNKHQGQYGNYTGVQDYQTSLDQLLAAQAAFDSLPARIRARFQNSPGEFLRFVSDRENEDEMRSLGLLKKGQPHEAAPTLPPKVAEKGPATTKKGPEMTQSPAPKTHSESE